MVVTLKLYEEVVIHIQICTPREGQSTKDYGQIPVMGYSLIQRGDLAKRPHLIESAHLKNRALPNGSTAISKLFVRHIQKNIAPGTAFRIVEAADGGLVGNTPREGVV